MRLGIIQLPYNIENLFPIVSQAKETKSDYYFFDTKDKINKLANEINEENIHFIDCDPFDVDTLVKLTSYYKLNNVISFAELGLSVAAQLRERLNFFGHNTEVERNSIDKYKMRELLLENNLTQVDFWKVNVADLKAFLEGFKFPLIVKPIDLVGSICVEYIEHIGQIDSYITRFQNHFYAKDRAVLIESYIEGKEYSVEGLILKDEIYLYGITEKQTSGIPYFVESGHLFSYEHSLKEDVQGYLKKVFSALSMKNCPFHVEFKKTEKGLEIIEVHSRFAGGFITDLIEHATGNKVFFDYFNFLDKGKMPVIPARNPRPVGIEFVLAQKGKLLELDVPDHIMCHSALIHAKQHYAIDSDILAATGYYDRIMRFMYYDNSSDEVKNLLRSIREDIKIEVI